MQLDLNYLAILVSGISAVVLGFLWYGPLFGKAWMKTVGVTSEQAAAVRNDPAKMQSMYRGYAITALGGLIMAFVLAHLLAFATAYYADLSALTVGLWVAVMAWAGLIVPMSLNAVLWEGKGRMYWFINAGYYLVTLLVMSVILSLWA